ncbi:hypothetical protein GQ44DRAFT_761370 [Phaeosphaeriaceae sp. PMI808]|nr:hypothetical protein GQ44DRAFT_761370 [Phaeosphaeriaceae sp. PMI808]
MARLKQPPQKATQHNSTPPPPTDTEAASQQLLAEICASASESSNPQESSAILGANLLNAARKDVRRGSPVHKMAVNGKLNRVSVLVRLPHQNRVRTRDVYDIPESPEKTTFGVREPVNVHRANEQPKKRRGDFPKQSNQNALESGSTGVPIEMFFPSGAPRCITTFYKYDKSQGGRYEQCRKPGASHTKHGFICPLHIQQPGAVQCEYNLSLDGGHAQCTTSGAKGTTRCRKHASINKFIAQSSPVRNSDQRSHKNDNATRASSKRSFDDGIANNSKLSKLTSNKRQAIIGFDEKEQDKHSNGRNSRANEPAAESNPCVQMHPLKVSYTNGKQTILEPQIADRGVHNLSQVNAEKPKICTEASNVSRPQSDDNDAVIDGGESDVTQNPDEEVSEKEEASVTHQRAKPVASCAPGTLNFVFSFLDLEEWPGGCKTKLGRSIERCCHQVSSLLQKENEDVSTKQISMATGRILDMLKGISDVDEAEHRDLKQDIYGYVFRSLTLVLRSLYDCFEGTEGDIMDSPNVVRLLCSFVHGILAFRDTVAKWKVSVPQRYRGDRTIKDANSHLITPLRDLGKKLIKRIRQLETKERSRKIQRRIEETEQELARKEEVALLRRERWKRWQDLHIARKQCEPNLARRRKLDITKLEDLMERDANGFRFERVPVFGNRSIQLLNSAPSILMQETWPDNQMIALLEGLERFAGPSVFYKIFETYCQPGGPLRDLSVTRIVAKAKWVHSNYEKLQHERGWKMPDWVKRISMLP